MTYGARVMVEDRALSEAMDEHPSSAERPRTGRLSSVTGALVERAKASGQLRADIVPETSRA